MAKKAKLFPKLRLDLEPKGPPLPNIVRRPFAGLLAFLLSVLKANQLQSVTALACGHFPRGRHTIKNIDFD